LGDSAFNPQFVPSSAEQKRETISFRAQKSNKKIKNKLTLVNTVLTSAQSTNVSIRQFATARSSNYTILQNVQLKNHGKKTRTKTK
jgi:hypothetical protein